MQNKPTIINEFIPFFEVEVKKGRYVKPHLLDQVNDIMRAITKECNNRVLINGYANLEEVVESLTVRKGEDNVK